MQSKKTGAFIGAAAAVVLMAVAATPARGRRRRPWQGGVSNLRRLPQRQAGRDRAEPARRLRPQIRSTPDFRYSNAMTHANLTWDDANLKAYIKDPQAKVKGNRMPFGGLSSDADIDDVIAFLKDYK